MYEDEFLSDQQKLILEQIRRMYDYTHDAFKTLDAKAQHVSSIASIVITIASGIRLTILQQGQVEYLIIIIFFYLVTMGFAIWTMLPRSFASEPLKPEWTYIRQNLSDPFDDFFHNLLSEYENVIKRNMEANEQKAKRLNWAYFFLVVTVVLALGMSVVFV